MQRFRSTPRERQFVTWTYDDGNGNTSTQTQNVVINDVTAPVPDLPTLADVTAECEVATLTPPTATDNCGGTGRSSSPAMQRFRSTPREQQLSPGPMMMAMVIRLPRPRT